MKKLKRAALGLMSLAFALVLMGAMSWTALDVIPMYPCPGIFEVDDFNIDPEIPH